MEARFNELVVETPEGVRFVYQLASPVARFLALSIDLFAISLIGSLVSAAAFMLRLISVDLAVAVGILFYFVLSIGYFIVMEAFFKGQTWGKRILKLRVIDANGLKLQANQIVIRNLLRFVDSLPVLYFLGGAFALFSQRFQRLGDVAAATVVVRIQEFQPPDLTLVSNTFYNSFREFPRLEAKLRQVVSPEESELALQALRRREELVSAERARLFGELANSLKEHVKFPEEAIASISDEQYVRNCVDTIYRESGKNR